MKSVFLLLFFFVFDWWKLLVYVLIIFFAIAVVTRPVHIYLIFLLKNRTEVHMIDVHSSVFAFSVLNAVNRMSIVFLSVKSC
ncbi:hypothetical protein COCON_G00087600 [Conger conger]|uniref:Uncharacterized protein n=1 Tax=Conger conger TaxID=82655 RepID=A0A9Q1DKD3_CONCO|nr:hypothetical protein COCON_G00087600 [Conger conger]